MGAYDAIGRGLSDLGGGIAGGVERGRDQAESRRRWEYEQAQHRAAIAREKADNDAAIPEWQQNALEGVLGVHTQATPGLSMGVFNPEGAPASPGPWQGGLGAGPGNAPLTTYQTDSAPRPRITVREAKNAQGLVSPYAGLTKSNNANQTRKDIAGENNKSREDIAGNKLDETQDWHDELAKIYRARIAVEAERARQTGDYGPYNAMLKALTTIEAVNTASNARVTASGMGGMDPSEDARRLKQESDAREDRKKLMANPPSPGERGAVKPPPAAGGKRGGKGQPPPKTAAPPRGMIKVSNGTESHFIQPADEAAAAKDGFRRI